MSLERARRKIFLDPGRREILGWMAASLAGGLALGRGEDARGQPDASRRPDDTPDLGDDLQNLRLVDREEGGRRFVLISPRYQSREQKIPLLVLLHGLGETASGRLGAYAWVEKYGLGSAWQRMKRDPIARTSRRGEWSDARLAEINTELAARPFRGFAMACPHMPNPKSPAEVDAYATWIEKVLVPRCQSEANVFTDPARTYLCGVSLGGYVSLELLVRLPHLFGAWGGVQTAIGTWAAPRYAAKIAAAEPKRPMLLLTSTQDHWKESSEALAQSFTANGIPHTFRLVPGPHDQPWLREAGTIETLHWFDRLLPA